MKSSKVIKIFWLISLAATAIVGGVMAFCAKYKPGTDFEPEKTILSIEFSCTAQDLCEAFSKNNTAMYNSLCLDFGFILCYTLLFYCSIRVLLVLFKTDRFRFIWLCLLPGLFDVAENMFMLPLINCDGCETGIAGFDLFFYAVRLKWLTVLPFTILTAIIAVYLLLEVIDKIRSKKPKAGANILN